MIIGIDGNEANIKDRVGVNKYAFEIIWGIYKLVRKSKNPIRIVIYLKHYPLLDMPKETANFKYKILLGGRLWILTKLMPYLFTNPDKLNVFFTPSHYLPLFAPMPKISSVMDLGYLKYSAQFKKYDFWQLKYWTALSIKISKYIMTISNATKDDIVRHYPGSKDKITVIHLGVDEYLINRKIQSPEIETVKKKYSIVGNYILYLGTLKPSKNIEGLIKAFAKLNTSVSKYQSTKLVIAGKKGWLYESFFRLVKGLKLEESVIFTGFIDEKDKPALIKGAKLFVIPSFWEGFGLDILSSFALKTPVVAANTGSIPEVVGDAGILINPKSIESITEGIKKVLSENKQKLNLMLEKGYNRVALFSWEKAATETLKILEKAADVN